MSLTQRVADVIARGAAYPLEDRAFNDLALEVFRHQFEANLPYRSYAVLEGVTPDSVRHWADIPLVPTRAFKALRLYCGDADTAQAVFRTSGTSAGAGNRGAHYVRDLSLYDASLLTAFKHWVLPDGVRPRMLRLVPAGATTPDSSLGYMADVVSQTLCAESGPPVLTEGVGVDVALVTETLAAWCRDTAPVLLFTTALALAALLEGMEARGLTCALPPGSRVMETGGFKGRRTAVSRTHLRARVRERLGIEGSFVVSEYGMTEMLSQFYEAPLTTPGASAALFRGPPWVRTRVLDPASLEPMPHGTIGVLTHMDLANLHSVSALLTEDLGVQRDGGFELLGRAEGSELRGCSLAFEELQRAQRGTRV